VEQHVGTLAIIKARLRHVFSKLGQVENEAAGTTDVTVVHQKQINSQEL